MDNFNKFLEGLEEVMNDLGKCGTGPMITIYDAYGETLSTEYKPNESLEEKQYSAVFVDLRDTDYEF